MDKQRVQYFVDEKNKVVVASINGCKYDSVYVINGIINNVSSKISFDPSYDSELLMRDSYKAVAKCDNEDEFNVEIGKKIALEKLIDRYHKSLNNRIDKFVRLIYRIHNESLDFLIRKGFPVEENDEFIIDSVF